MRWRWRWYESEGDLYPSLAFALTILCRVLQAEQRRREEEWGQQKLKMREEEEQRNIERQNEGKEWWTGKLDPDAGKKGKGRWRNDGGQTGRRDGAEGRGTARRYTPRTVEEMTPLQVSTWGADASILLHCQY